MPTLKMSVIAAATLALLAGCGGGGLRNRDRPDEFLVARSAPLVVPPDFALAPPRPGEPTPVSSDNRTQALQVLFGGPAQRSAAETQVLREAGADRADPGARSSVTDQGTVVVDKGATTQTIINAPEGSGAEATASTPQ